MDRWGPGRGPFVADAQLPPLGGFLAPALVVLRSRIKTDLWDLIVMVFISSKCRALYRDHLIKRVTAAKSLQLDTHQRETTEVEVWGNGKGTRAKCEVGRSRIRPCLRYQTCRCSSPFLKPSLTLDSQLLIFL